MRIEIACFTERGRALGARLAESLRAAGEDARLTRCGDAVPLRTWVKESFRAADALLFLGAAGIAVRATAPLIDNKTKDPAVIVMDDAGRFAVPLLSGHLGGANELARRFAKIAGATPVITTATDGAGIFAVDDWARRAGLFVANPERIKSVSSRLLAGETLRLRTPFPVEGTLPEGITFLQEEANEETADIVVDVVRPQNPAALHLVPRAAALGVGCRKNIPPEAVETASRTFCETTRIPPEAFAKVCSVDLKKDEPALLRFCEAHSLPFETFPAETLAHTKGDFAASEFVAAVTGVDNVCARAAVAGSGGGTLVTEKTLYDGVTMAAARGAYTLLFPHGDGEENA